MQKLLFLLILHAFPLYFHIFLRFVAIDNEKIVIFASEKQNTNIEFV